MSTWRASLQEPEVLIDHISAYGPHVTHVRGTLITGSRESLRAIGAFGRYQAALKPEARDGLDSALATSWVPIAVAQAHYQACDALTLESAQISQIGQFMAARIVRTFGGSALRVARAMGADSYRWLLMQNDRIYDRMYQGGGVTVLQTGPKDVLLENFGQPLAECRYWRLAYHAYIDALCREFAKVAFVKLVRPSRPEKTRIAIAGSWV